jgi:hypothetical protein
LLKHLDVSATDPVVLADQGGGDVTALDQVTQAGLRLLLDSRQPVWLVELLTSARGDAPL